MRPPAAERGSASGSSPPHELGSGQLSFCPAHAGRTERTQSKCVAIWTQRGAPRRCNPAHLSVQAELLDFVDAVDHHVHERQQRFHVFGRSVAHARHYPETSSTLNIEVKRRGHEVQ